MLRSPLIFFATTGILAIAVALPTQSPVALSKVKKTKQTIDFNRDVRPILSEHCFKCHGPDAKEAKGDLRLSDAKSATKDRDGYRVISPGHADDSIILGRVTTSNADVQMPPPAAGVARLTKEQVAVLKQWISEGAEFKKHWAFITPEAPAIPVTKNKLWARNSIDSFVLAALEKKGLEPEAGADKGILLRRVYLTLTGLSPTTEELNQFLSDSAPNAYEKAVDSVLASERYGEHQARFWLDAVRYADTHGLHLDNERAIYPYRDWVVRAFNRDLPFNDFALQQLAGDLLPDPEVETKLATGYIRMNPTTNEGGAIEEEFLVKNTFDRVDTTSTVFLGLTATCAKCHDHKYDPISQKDYYQMFAFFNSTEDVPLDGNLLAPEPSIKAYDKKMLSEKVRQEVRLASLLEKLPIEKAREWFRSAIVSSSGFGAWQVSEATSSKDFEEAFANDTPPKTWQPRAIEQGKIVSIVKKENAYAYAKTTIAASQANEAILRLGSDDGVKVWLNGKLVHSNKALRGAEQETDEVKLSLVAGTNDLLIKIANNGGGDGLRVLMGNERDTTIAQTKALLDKPGQEYAIKQAYFMVGSDDAFAKEYRKTKEAFTKFEASIPISLVAKELKTPRKAYILRRGEYDLRDKEVKRAVPAALGSIPKNAPANRLGFAMWLTDKRNPLFARVFVNRVWQQHFGTGIVKTSEDFGNQGEWPSHPELLDYLAVKFSSEGYSLKKLHKLILMSSAFRQSAKITKAKLLKDPENRLVSRGPRFRLDAEVLRDQVLSVSGLLYNREGGHGFKPYQPAGLWEEVAFPISTTGKYAQDMTQEIYRRSLYLFWKRTSPHPAMLAFDAPMREACVVRRPRTNTPLQSLVTMNEPAFVEASRVFAEKIVKTKIGDENRLRYAFRKALSREPRANELQIMLAASKRYYTRFKSSLSEANELIKVGMKPVDPQLNPAEVATWTLVANTIFNLDEFLTQH
jgi:Protein of unknown function (DUF1553)/Protein of unknown function (DUF1549)/Planctomycete cytochrome C